MSTRVWLITGISSGLGKALAEAVIAKGDVMIGTFRQASQVEAFQSRRLDNAHAVVLDITNPQQITECITHIISKFGHLDILVNNAGVGFVGAIEEASLNEVRRVFEANFFGTLQLTQTVLPFMRQKKKGHIVQISSHAGIKAFAGFGIYNASKFALEGFSEALAQEVAPLGITVTIVEPGPFRTNFAGESLLKAETMIEEYETTAGAFRAKLKSVHGKQEGDPNKAAQAILDYIDADSRTLRLPLGKVSIHTIGMKIEHLSSDIAKHKKIAEGVVFE